MGVRHASSFMSLWILGSSDMLRLPCRLGKAGGATSFTNHVAPHRCVRRHSRSPMSPFTSSSSDMQGLGCRASHGSGATCCASCVAPHAWEVRHRSGGSVARPLWQGDIPPLALLLESLQATRSSARKDGNRAALSQTKPEET